MIKIQSQIILYLLVFLLYSCDKGLEPQEKMTPALLKGRVIFKNEWPKIDSVFGIRAGAFKSPPSENLISEVINGNAFFNLQTLGYNIDSASFKFEIDKLPVELVYIVIAWQYEDDLSMQRVIGVYNTNNDKTKPSSVYLENGDSVNIEIEVNWNDFPPQPF